MKSAKQWVDEVVNSPEEKMDPEEFVKMVQLDSWKQGVTDAAEVQLNENDMMSCTCCRRADKAIRALCDSKTQI